MLGEIKTGVRTHENGPASAISLGTKISYLVESTKRRVLPRRRQEL